MSIYAMQEFAMLMAAAVALAVILSIIFAKLWVHWSARRAVLWAALPGPALVLTLCVIIFVLAALASEESCGVDACAMGMMAATFIGIYALVAAFAGLVAAWLVRRIGTR